MVIIADRIMACRAPSPRKAAPASSRLRLAWPRSGSASSCVAGAASSWLGCIPPWERIGSRDPLPGSAIRGDHIPVKSEPRPLAQARQIRAAAPGEQWHEHPRAGGSPAGHRVPAGARRIAGDRRGRKDECVAAGGDAVERRVVKRAAGDAVDGGVDEASDADHTARSTSGLQQRM